MIRDDYTYRVVIARHRGVIRIEKASLSGGGSPVVVGRQRKKYLYTKVKVFQKFSQRSQIVVERGKNPSISICCSRDSKRRRQRACVPCEFVSLVRFPFCILLDSYKNYVLQQRRCIYIYYKIVKFAVIRQISYGRRRPYTVAELQLRLTV